MASALMLTAKATVPAYAMTPHETSRLKADPKVSSSLRGIFGAIELRTNAARGAERWPEVMKRATKERREWLACERDSKDCPAKLKAWREGLAKAKGLTRWQQIVEVNRLVNSLVRFRNDIDRYGVADHWATPKEALLQSGDCEDYAILKYLSLRELGFRDKDMRMVVLKISRRGIGHAVLAVNHEGGRYILDNLVPKPVEHSVVKGYKPIYSVNTRGQWLALQVKPATTQVASLKPMMRAPALLKGNKPESSVGLSRQQGLKLLEPALLAAVWDQLVITPLPHAGWGYAFFQPRGYFKYDASSLHEVPRI